MDENGYTFARWLLENPEKSALGAVIIAGVWRVLREIWKDVRGQKSETLVESLMRENHDLREEVSRLKQEVRKTNV